MLTQNAMVQSDVDTQGSHRQAKTARKNIQDSLAKMTYLIEGTGEYAAPIFIFIDELDRCRPTYAIELLETLKHIFYSPNVIFVVATNTDQLHHSISAIYGQKFDSPKYLKRFFDMEYRLAEPKRSLMLAAELEHTGILKSKNIYSPFIDRCLDLIHLQSDNDSAAIESARVRFAIELAVDYFKLNLRDIKQVLFRIDVGLRSADRPVDIFWLSSLIAANHRSGEAFNSIISPQTYHRPPDLVVHDNLDFADVQKIENDTASKNTRSSVTNLLKHYSQLSVLKSSQISGNRLGSTVTQTTAATRLVSARFESDAKTYYTNLVERVGSFTS